MRFVFAIVAFVVAAFMIGLGIAQHTFLAAPERLEVSATVEGEPRFAVIDGAVLNSYPGLQTLEVAGPGTVFAAYGRTEDVTAWLGETEFARISFSDETGELTSTVVDPSRDDGPESTPTPEPSGTDPPVAPEPGSAEAAPAPAGSAPADAAPVEEATEEVETAPNPAGSDLWLSERSAQENLRMNTRLPENLSVIIASDGSEPVPASISLTWPLETTTPWAGPLIIGGSVLAVIGVILYLWALHHMRKTRGPRRSSAPKMPKPPRIQRVPSSPIESLSRGRRSSRRRMVAAAPVLLVPALLLTGCSADAWPDFLRGASTVTPVATPESTLEAAIENEDAPQPVVTAPQLESIVQDISETTATADATLDEELLKTRFSGPALEQRLANYRIRGVKTDEPVPVPIPSGDVILALPQATESWPRTIYTVVKNPDDEAAPTLALFLVQQTPRDNYTVQYSMRIVSSDPLPEVAPAEIGATRLEPDVKLLTMRPDAVATAYADILSKGDASEFLDAFLKEGDTVRDQFGPAVQEQAKADLGPTGTIDFVKQAGTAEPIAIATIDSGAIVATHITEVETTRPTDPRASLKVNGGATQALLGAGESTKGVELTYSDQLLFYVPPVNSGEQVRLIGFEQQLVSAKELP